MVSRLIGTSRATSFAALLGVAIVVAGCGSSGSSSSSSSPAANSPATVSRAAASTVSLGTASGSPGTHLTGASGKALYLWAGDTGKKSSCAGACAKAWPPVIARTRAAAGHGVTASDLGVITRADGSKQVTYKGHPLYYFIEDSQAGMTKGQGSDAFGAKWSLVSPSGTAISQSSSSSSGGAAPAGSSYGGY